MAVTKTYFHGRVKNPYKAIPLSGGQTYFYNGTGKIVGCKQTSQYGYQYSYVSKLPNESANEIQAKIGLIQKVYFRAVLTAKNKGDIIRGSWLPSSFDENASSEEIYYSTVDTLLTSLEIGSSQVDKLVYSKDDVYYSYPEGSEERAVLDTLNEEFLQKLNRYVLWRKSTYNTSATFDETSTFGDMYYEVILLDEEAPSNVRITRPSDGVNIMLGDSVTIEWTYSQEAGVPQSHIDVDYSSNGGESWNAIISKYRTSDTTYTISAGVLPVGSTLIRVRAYTNEGAIPGNYSTVYIYVRVQASTSSVTCDGKPLPTISWTSSAQVAYQVRFSDYDSGARYGTETSLTIPYFYADGYYPVQVRTQASDGTWSAWTELEYVQITNTAQPNSITLTAVQTRHAVVLDWTDSGTSENYIVYRNDIPIYIGTDTSYTDITANGKCTYYVRAVQATHYYSQSDSVVLEAYPKADCIYDFSSMQWIPLKFSLQERTRMYTKSMDVVYKNYVGRPKPVVFTSGYTSRQMSGAYVFKTRDEALRLVNAVGHTVIFKDTRGGTIIGTLNNPNIDVRRKLYSVTFTVTETDYKEAVEYDTA